jgi:general secretion pathway protein D
LKNLNPLRTFRLLTAAYAVTAPVVVPTGVVVAIGSASVIAVAQQAGGQPGSPSSTLPPLPSNAPGLLPPAPANPPAAQAANPARDQASGLAAQAKLALQRGDLATAKQLIDQAAAMKVPDNQFGPGQLKPWDVAMDVERAIRLRGNAPVQTAGATSPATAGGKVSDAPGAVQPGLYQPGADPSRMAQASSLSMGPGAIQDQDLTAQDWYARGIDAMALGDRDAAASYFSNAWKKQNELDPATRAQLKDKLMYLQSRDEPESINAIPAENREAIQKKQRLFAEVSGEIADAERMVNDKPYESIDRLKSLRTRVAQSDVDGAYRKQMLSMVDRVIANVEAWMEQNRSSIELDQRNTQIEDRITFEAANAAKEDSQVQTLVDQYNDLMEDKRYAEAEMIARKVEEIKPNSEIAAVMRGRSVIQRRIEEQKEIQNMKEESLLNSFSDTERSSATYLRDNQPLQFPDVKEWTDLRRIRDKYADESLKLQPSERRILEILEEPFSASFDRRPLSEALKTISEMTGLIILIDEPSIAEEGLRSDQPISLDLRGNQIKLKNVLKNILEPLNLSYAIKNEVVKIQSRRFMQQEMYSKPYPLKDLVIPVPNFISDYNTGLAGAIQSAYQAQTNYVAVNLPEQDGMSLRSNKLASIDPNSNVLAQFASAPVASPMGLSPGMSTLGMDPNPMSGSPSSLGGASMANFTELMNLIQTTISPDQWADAGGTATMMPFRQNLSLIVNAPQETHEQIADLLKSLRALQNLQVTIELRFIQLQDTFFEKIGVDFDAQWDDNVRRLPSEDGGPSVVVGLSGATGAVPTLTGDFDIQLRQGSFGVNPPFGNPDLAAGSQIGLAILSDLELFFFLQAAQGNSRQNILQAPKVTMFDGQIGTINDSAVRPFVIGFDPVVGDFAVAQRPIIVVLSEGTQMNVQSVVSQDKRFVRLTLMPQFTRLEATDREFTFQGRTVSRSGTSILNPGNGLPTGGRNNEEEVIEGTTVQQPTLGTTSVSTTVSVPDGGTILMGGIKRLREGRTERGTPMLSKIPYLNRLFKNSAIGRETSTLMFTVTPRIIIPAEEEEQLGIAPTSP